jgi:hypothetical protein
MSSAKRRRPSKLPPSPPVTGQPDSKQAALDKKKRESKWFDVSPKKK